MSSTQINAVKFDFRLTGAYQRTDDPTNLSGILDTLNYPIKGTFLNGHTTNEANLQAHWESTLNNNTEYWNLNSGNIYDAFGNLLNYESVKILVINNKADPIALPDHFLEIHFKNEQYYIGPGGCRIIFEPFAQGLSAIVSSRSQEEGTMSVTANGLITYDVILIGSTLESSSGP